MTMLHLAHYINWPAVGTIHIVHSDCGYDNTTAKHHHQQWDEDFNRVYVCPECDTPLVTSTIIGNDRITLRG